MTRPDLRPVDTDTGRREALDVVEQLKTALKVHGIVLPSLDVDTPSFARFTGHPLIDLGRINYETAKALVAALASRDGARS